MSLLAGIRDALNPNTPAPPQDDFDWEGVATDLLAALDAVLALHREIRSEWGPVCRCCKTLWANSTPYPCNTVALINSALGEGK